MKKSSLLIIMMFCLGFLLSSCSKLANISVTKRHYRSGYHVDFASNKQQRVKPEAPEVITAAATPSVSDKLKDKSEVSPEKTAPELSPVFISGNTQEKKQAHINESSNVYASTQDNATIKTEMPANKIVSNESGITSTMLSSSESTPQWLLICFAILLPPLAIALKFGIETKFWISILLTLLFWIPGVIYALYWVLQK
jgi:uncharacterized membrane protein YqaE (UPF0057 family)